MEDKIVVLATYLKNNVAPGVYRLKGNYPLAIVITQNKKVFIHDLFYDNVISIYDAIVKKDNIINVVTQFVNEHKLTSSTHVKDVLKEIIAAGNEYLVKIGYNEKTKVYFNMMGEQGQLVKEFAHTLTKFSGESNRTTSTIEFITAINSVKEKVNILDVKEMLELLKELNIYNIQSIKQKLDTPQQVVKFILKNYHNVVFAKDEVSHDASIDSLRSIIKHHEAKQKVLLNDLHELVTNL